MWGRLGEIYDRAVSSLKPKSWSSRSFDWRPYKNNITAEKAHTNSTFNACLNFILGNIYQLPWKVYRPTKKSPHASDSSHPAYWLLDRRANPEMSASVWRQLMLYHTLIYGNCYSEIQRDTANRPIALWPIEPWRVLVDRDDSGSLIYVVDNGNNHDKTILNPMDVYHVPGLGDGIVGFGIIPFAARSLGIAINADEYGLSFFGNSGVPSGVLKHPGRLSEVASKRLNESMRELRGATRANQTMILEEGMEWSTTGLPPEQSQFLATREFSVQDICRWFNVPPSKVGQMIKASYNTIEQIGIEVVTDCLMPWVKKFEQEADYKLLGNNRGDVYSKIDLRGLMRSTHVDRAAYYRSLFSIGAISINEIREWEDLDPVENGELHMVPMNMTPLEFAVKEPVDPATPQVPDTQDTQSTSSKDNPPGGVPKVKTIARRYIENGLQEYGLDVDDVMADITRELGCDDITAGLEHDDKWDGKDAPKQIA